MLKENEDLISFHPGSKKNGKVILARIEVHNRAQVEQKILPRYFNHNSFASLRRQLNYFCFTRLGKGRQKGAAYCNEAVIVMEDILKLKRRPHVGGATGFGTTTLAATPLPTVAPSTGKHQRSVSISSIESSSDTQQVGPLKKARLSTITPLHLGHAFEQNKNPCPTLVLDLTTSRDHNGDFVTGSTPLRPLPKAPSSPTRDDDVLAGCRALLSFSRGPPPGRLLV
jgi:hypothetical protein